MARKYLIKVNNKTYEVEVEEVVRRSTIPLVMPQAAEVPPTVLPPGLRFPRPKQSPCRCLPFPRHPPVNQGSRRWLD